MDDTVLLRSEAELVINEVRGLSRTSTLLPSVFYRRDDKNQREQRRLAYRFS